MKKAIRIGGASAFWGDSSIGPLQLVNEGDIDYLVFDYLAELTMSILAGARLKNPEAGYATDFVTVAMKSVIRNVAERGIRVISNAGGVNPAACAAALEKICAEAGVHLNIAVVEGDNVMSQIPVLGRAGTVGIDGKSPIPQSLVTANAYLGALPILTALNHGAQIVVTGRCVDSAVTLAALMHEFNWTSADYDQLAAGALAGHIIECGCQATGGLHTDWRDVPDWANIGYPIVECHSNGDFIVTKPGNTGGLVNWATVAEQMLYEIADPTSYMLPDVICDFTGVKITDVGANRVRVTGAKGRTPSSQYKVSATYMAGFRLSAQLTIIGFEAADKAQRTGEALIERLRQLFRAQGLEDFEQTNIELLGTESAFGQHAKIQNSREVVLRVSVRHPQKKALELMAREVAAPGTSWSPGTTGAAAGRPTVSPVLKQFGFLIDKNLVHPIMTLGEIKLEIGLPAILATRCCNLPVVSVMPVAPPDEDKALLTEVPLIDIAYGRSGDKGDTSNIGLIAREEKWIPYLLREVTPERVKDYLSHLVGGDVHRYQLPGIGAINLVCESALGGGGMASLRNDPLGKGMAQILLGMPVHIPTFLFTPP